MYNLHINDPYSVEDTLQLLSWLFVNIFLLNRFILDHSSTT